MRDLKNDVFRRSGARGQRCPAVKNIVFFAAVFWLLGWPATAAARPWPESRSRIIVFADQLPEGMNEAQRQFAATHLAGTQKMRLSEIRALRAYNADFLCLHYQLGIGCGAHEFIIGDEWTSDWPYVNSQESFFLHNSSGQRVHQAAWDWDVMNIVNAGGAFQSGFPEYWLTTCLDRITANEDDGVFADSFTVDGYFDQCDPSHAWFQDVDSCLANWIPSLAFYGAVIKSRFEADGRNYRFLPNLGGLITSWDTMNYLIGHGGMVEGFCFFGPDDYFEMGDWQLQLERTLELVRANAIVICQTYIGATANISDRMFALAGYLLVKGQYTYISLLVNDGLEYYPEYTVGLGEALGGIPARLADLWDESRQVYIRQYTHGLVVVNPDISARQITLTDANYLNVIPYGGGAVNESGSYDGSISLNAVTSLTVAAHSGAILLTTSSNSVWAPLAADFDGDGFADLALYDETGNASASGPAGTWLFRLSSKEYQRFEMDGWLGSMGWAAVVGDVDGDGKADPGVYEPETASWSIRFSGQGYNNFGFARFLGAAGWIGLMADFDGDRLADPAVCEPASGRWFIGLSGNEYEPAGFTGFPDGSGWQPLAADFDGDRLADPAACQPSSGTWSVLFSADSYQRIDFPGLLGETNAIPVAADFDNDRLADPGIYRPATLSWRLLLSGSGYQPVNVNSW